VNCRLRLDTSDRNLIYTTPGGGELWMGGYPHGDDLEGFHCVVSMVGEAEWFRAPKVPAYIRLPMDDRDEEFHENPRLVHEVRALARSVARMLGEGKVVLIHCGAGLNRSGVATARVLMELGMSADMAINVVRTRRLPPGNALFNRGFVRWLLEEDGKPLPTAETSVIS